MGHWGVKSYENDAASDAIDAGFERVRGDVYDALMDDRDTTPFDEAQKQLASPETLAAALEALREAVGADAATPWDDFDDVDRLAFAGVVVRHAEFGVTVPEAWLARAIEWLEYESIEWDEATARGLRKQHEIKLLERLGRGE